MIKIVKLGPGNKENIGKYRFVNRIIKLLNQLSAEVLVTFSCKLHIVRKKVGKVIIIVRRSEGFLKCGDEMSKSGGKSKTGSEM
jgi:hypothetical protein